MGSGLAGEGPGAAGEIAQHDGAGPGRDVPAMVDPQPGARAHELDGGLVAESTAERLGRRDDQRVDLTLSIGGCVDR